MNTSLSEKVCLVTGASVGLGAAIALNLAGNGANKLVLVARRLEKLNSLVNEIKTKYPNVKCHCASVDVKDAEAVRVFAESLPEEFKDVYLLVNNAGAALGLCETWNTTQEQIDGMLDLNVKGVLHFIRAFVPGMVKKNAGHVVNISSTAAIDHYANGSIYCASKAAVDAISKSLRIELIATQVRVSVISPGMVEGTEFSFVRLNDPEKAKTVYKGIQALTAIDVAEAVYYMVSRPPHVQISNMVIMPTNQAAGDKVHKVL